MSRSYLGRDVFWECGWSTTVGVTVGPEIRIKNIFRSGILGFDL